MHACKDTYLSFTHEELLKQDPDFTFLVILTALIFFLNFPLKRFEQLTTNTPFSLNRNEKHLIFTRHARCRMDCRHITATEIEEILHTGRVNYTKSDLNNEHGATVALEGYTHDQQHVRVVFAPKSKGLVVITCIDLDYYWHCDCN